MDTLTRHRALVMLGVVRTMADVDDDPYELDEVSAAIVDALDLLDGEERRKAPLRIPKGFEGGGQFRSISDSIFKALKDWAGGEGPDNPFEGDALKGVLSPDPKRRREQLRNAAKARGITLRRGASETEIANALLDHVRKGRKGDDRPDAKPVKKAAPKKAPAKAAPKAVDPADIAQQLSEVESTAAGRALLADMDARQLRDLADHLGVGLGRNKADTQQRILDITVSGRLDTKAMHEAMQRGPRADAPDSVTLARARQADIDTARTYAHLASELDELTANEVSDATLLARLESSVRRGDLPEAEVAPILAAVRERREVEVENRVRAAFRALVGRTDLEEGGTEFSMMPGMTPQRLMRQGGYVSIADLRDEVGPDIPRTELGEALKRIAIHDPGANAVPESAQGSLTAHQRAGAIHFGDQDKHWLIIDDPSDRPAPDARPLVAALLASRGITQDGAAGESGRFDPKVHQPIDGTIRQGAAVEVVRPGFTLTRDGERIRLSRAVVEEAGEAPPARLSDAEVEGRVRVAYRELLTGRQGRHRDNRWVSLADLRERLGADLPREDVDRVLDRMIERPDVQLMAQLNQRALTGRERDAAVSIGGEDRDVISIDESTPTTTDPEAARDALDLKKVPELKAMLREAGLPVSGRKRELVDRLVGHVHPGGDVPDVAEMQPVGRPSGLPTDRKLESADFDDLVDRLTGKTEDQIYDLLQDLVASELTRLARKYSGGRGGGGLGGSQNKPRGLAIPAGMTLDERRRWLAAKIAEQRWQWRSDDMDAETRDRVLALAEMRFADEMRAINDNQLKRYWTVGEGLKRWRFHPHPWTKLRNLLRKHVGPGRAERMASEWFHTVFGYWPGHRKGDNPVGPG